MPCRSRLLSAALLLALSGPGCVRVATAPLREARQEKAEEGFSRLAAFTPQQLAAFLDNGMTLTLGLSGRQQIAIEAIDLKYARQLHDTAASTAELRSKVRALRAQETAKETELKTLLTPEQFSRYLEKKEEMRAALRSWAGTN